MFEEIIYVVAPEGVFPSELAPPQTSFVGVRDVPQLMFNFWKKSRPVNSNPVQLFADLSFTVSRNDHSVKFAFPVLKGDIPSFVNGVSVNPRRLKCEAIFSLGGLSLNSEHHKGALLSPHSPVAVFRTNHRIRDSQRGQCI